MSARAGVRERDCGLTVMPESEFADKECVHWCMKAARLMQFEELSGSTACLFLFKR